MVAVITAHVASRSPTELGNISARDDERLKNDESAVDPSAGARFLIASSPLGIAPHPVDGSVSREELRRVLDSLRTYFDRRPTQGSVPTSTLLHALRLWGGERPDFQPVVAATEARVFEAHPLSVPDMVDCLLNHDRYVKECAIRGEALLVPSRYGIRVMHTATMSYGSDETESHFGKLISVLAEANIPASFPVVAAGSYEGDVAEMLRDTAARVTSGMELEWASAGLARYAACSSWTNRFGTKISFGLLADQLAKRRPGVGACGGSHVPYSLTVLLRVNEQKPVFSAAVDQQVRQRLGEYAQAMAACQQADGSWPWDWPRWMRNGVISQPPALYQDELIQVVAVAGHNLEWMALAPADCRPRTSVMKNAARFIVVRWPEIEHRLSLDWHYYPVISHAARAVWLVSDFSYEDVSSPKTTYVQGVP